MHGLVTKSSGNDPFSALSLLGLSSNRYIDESQSYMYCLMSIEFTESHVMRRYTLVGNNWGDRRGLQFLGAQLENMFTNTITLFTVH